MAKWIVDNEFDETAVCSNCGNFVHTKGATLSSEGYFPKYCDECGEKMDFLIDGDGHLWRRSHVAGSIADDDFGSWRGGCDGHGDAGLD